MSTIDCKVTENFFKEKTRYTKRCNIQCFDCMFNYDNNGEGKSCTNFIENDPEKAIAMLQKWSDTHPIKTRSDAFLELFPNTMVTPAGRVDMCPCNIDASIKNNEHCSSMSCNQCIHDYWEAPNDLNLKRR